MIIVVDLLKIIIVSYSKEKIFCKYRIYTRYTYIYIIRTYKFSGIEIFLMSFQYMISNSYFQIHIPLSSLFNIHNTRWKRNLISFPISFFEENFLLNAMWILFLGYLLGEFDFYACIDIGEFKEYSHLSTTMIIFTSFLNFFMSFYQMLPHDKKYLFLVMISLDTNGYKCIHECMDIFIRIMITLFGLWFQSFNKPLYLKVMKIHDYNL